MDSSIFEEHKDLGLQHLFQSKTQEDFSRVEVLKFESRLKHHFNSLFQEKQTLIEKADHLRNQALFQNWTRSISETQSLLFREGLPRLFSQKLDEGSVETFIKTFLQEFHQLENQILSLVIKQLLKFLKNPQNKDPALSSIQKNLKRIPWSEKEEQILLELMSRSYPYNVSNEELQKFSDSFNRTKCSVVNKIHKMKKKFSSLFDQKSEQLIDSSINGMVGQSLEEKIFATIQGEERTFEDILRSLKVQVTDLDMENQVNDTLYGMLSNFRVKQKEKIFVELNLQRASGIEKSSSIFLKAIVEFMKQQDSLIQDIQHIKQFLIENFKEVDPYKPNFD